MTASHPFDARNYVSSTATPPKHEHDYAALLTVTHNGVCIHCLQYRMADDVFCDLPRLDRVVCLSCYYTITGTRPQIPKQIAADVALAAEGKD